MTPGSDNPTFALEALYLEHEPSVRSLLRTRGITDAVLEDLVHETFVAIHRRWSGRDLSIPVAQWILGVARNVAFSHRRAESRRRDQLRSVPAPCEMPAPDEAVARREAWTSLEGFVETLSPKLREVFVLAEVSGVPMNDVSRLTRVPVATLHSRLRLARGRFSAHFGGLDDEQARTMIARATQGEAPSDATRRRSLAALLLHGGRSTMERAAFSGTPAGALTLVGWAAATALAVLVLGTQIGRPAASVPAGTTSDSPSTRASAPSALPLPLPLPLPIAEPALLPTPERTASAAAPAPRTDAKTTTPRHGARVGLGSTAPDPLAVHVAALQRARERMAAGDATGALAALDAVVQPLPSLAVDYHRVELRAACAAGDLARARRAAGSPARRDIAVDLGSPCPSTSGDRPGAEAN